MPQKVTRSHKGEQLSEKEPVLMYYIIIKCATRGSLPIKVFAVIGILGQNVQSAYFAYSTALHDATLLRNGPAIYISHIVLSSRDG